MAVFTIAQGETLRMDRLSATGYPWSELIVRPDGFIEVQMVGFDGQQQYISYKIVSVAPVLSLPYGLPSVGGAFYTVNLTFSARFFDHSVSETEPVGLLTGIEWQGAQLYEYEIGGVAYHALYPPDGWGWPSFFRGNDVVTLGDGDDVFYDYHGDLVLSLGGGNDEAWLYDDGTRGVADKVVDAGAGNDRVYYQFGNVTILGGAGNDEIRPVGGADGVSLFVGGVGNDTIEAYGRSARIEDERGSGSDVYISFWSPDYADHSVVLSYASGNRGIVVDLQNDRVSGGGHGTDTVIGVSEIEGTQGNDRMTGERIWMGMHNGQWIDRGVIFWGLSGSDTLEGAEADDVLFGGNQDDFLFGSDGRDTLDGGRGNDVLDGGDGDDVLTGGLGNDSLIGGLGADRMNGGKGADVFVYRSAEDSTVKAPGRDRIDGFSVAEDRIDLSEIDAQPRTAAKDAFVFIGTADFTGHGQIRYEHVGKTTVVTMNLRGDLRPDMRIDLVGIHTLTEDNFLV